MISLCDNVEKITALGNDFCFEEIFRFQLGNLMNEGDVLISVSASGNSPDLVRACQYAGRKGQNRLSWQDLMEGQYGNSRMRPSWCPLRATSGLRTCI